MRHEAHIGHPTEHEDSVDCWCEPSRIYWYTNAKGVTMLVVEHNDDIPVTRTHRIALRERDRNIVNIGRDWGIDEPWITRKLDAIPQLPPPHDHNERSL